MQSFEVHFTDGRRPLVHEDDGMVSRPLVHEDDGMVSPLVWASDTELVYRRMARPLSPDAKATLRVFCIENGQSRALATVEDTMSVAAMGRPEHLSVLAQTVNREGLFDLDTQTGALQRLHVYDSALEALEVYPLFRHSWFAARQEVALIAWPRDFLEEGEEPTQWNSQWTPILDTPWIQDDVSVQRDGSRITQRELIQQARRNKPFRLFLLDNTGACLEAPGTYNAHHPVWSPDGSLLAFLRYEAEGSGLWLLNRSDLSLRRMGSCLTSSPVMHPSGVLFCWMIDETIPKDREHERERMRSARWHPLDLRNGNARITQHG